YNDVHHLSTIFARQLSLKGEKIADTEGISKELHKQFFGHIQSFILSSQEQGFIKKNLPSSLIISMIFHSVMINDSSELNHIERAEYIREILTHGIFQK
ncbi:MAG: TetR/AcrR family transcriptional regulator, partial [Pisciglobus halotolerans]|nr:TetR/AcrR family transcriptional regulator [Pisciglobus halotolerans]